MTAYPEDIATVQRLLPVRIDPRRSLNGSITILDKNDKMFCRVPFDISAHSRAVVIVSALNALQDSLVPSRSHHGL